MDPREREIINIEKEIDAIQQTLRDNLAVKIEENRAEENFDHESETYECSICASTEIKKSEIGSGFPTLNPPSSTKQKEMKNHHKDTKKVHPKSVLQSFVSSFSNSLSVSSTYPYLCSTTSCHDLIVCNSCLKTHFVQIVSSGYLGACPPMRCISCQQIVSSEVWQRFVPQGIKAVVSDRASALLTLQCGSCHARKSLMVEEVGSPKQSQEIHDAFIYPVLCEEEEDVDGFTSEQESEILEDIDSLHISRKVLVEKHRKHKRRRKEWTKDDYRENPTSQMQKDEITRMKKRDVKEENTCHYDSYGVRRTKIEVFNALLSEYLKGDITANATIENLILLIPDLDKINYSDLSSTNHDGCIARSVRTFTPQSQPQSSNSNTVSNNVSNTFSSSTQSPNDISSSASTFTSTSTSPSVPSSISSLTPSTSASFSLPSSSSFSPSFGSSSSTRQKFKRKMTNILGKERESSLTTSTTATNTEVRSNTTAEKLRDPLTFAESRVNSSHHLSPQFKTDFTKIESLSKNTSNKSFKDHEYEGRGRWQLSKLLRFRQMKDGHHNDTVATTVKSNQDKIEKSCLTLLDKTPHLTSKMMPPPVESENLNEVPNLQTNLYSDPIYTNEVGMRFNDINMSLIGTESKSVTTEENKNTFAANENAVRTSKPSLKSNLELKRQSFHNSTSSIPTMFIDQATFKRHRNINNQNNRDKPFLLGDSLMGKILSTIKDAERRATLQVAYLKKFPLIYTNCCKRMHCFICRTKDFHHGLSCDQHRNKLYMKSNFTDEILCCPTCNLQLVKGDGCNNITCICGESFNWNRLSLKTKQLRDLAAFELMCPPPFTARICTLLIMVHLHQYVDFEITSKNVQTSKLNTQQNVLLHKKEYFSKIANRRSTSTSEIKIDADREKKTFEDKGFDSDVVLQTQVVITPQHRSILVIVIKLGSILEVADTLLNVTGSNDYPYATNAESNNETNERTNKKIKRLEVDALLGKFLNDINNFHYTANCNESGDTGIKKRTPFKLTVLHAEDSTLLAQYSCPISNVDEFYLNEAVSKNDITTHVTFANDSKQSLFLNINIPLNSHTTLSNFANRIENWANHNSRLIRSQRALLFQEINPHYTDEIAIQLMKDYISNKQPDLLNPRKAKPLQKSSLSWQGPFQKVKIEGVNCTSSSTPKDNDDISSNNLRRIPYPFYPEKQMTGNHAEDDLNMFAFPFAHRKEKTGFLAQIEHSDDTYQKTNVPRNEEKSKIDSNLKKLSLPNTSLDLCKVSNSRKVSVKRATQISKLHSCTCSYCISQQKVLQQKKLKYSFGKKNSASISSSTCSVYDNKQCATAEFNNFNQSIYFAENNNLSLERVTQNILSKFDLNQKFGLSDNDTKLNTRYVKLYEKSDRNLQMLPLNSRIRINYLEETKETTEKEESSNTTNILSSPNSNRKFLGWCREGNINKRLTDFHDRLSAVNKMNLTFDEDHVRRSKSSYFGLDCCAAETKNQKDISLHPTLDYPDDYHTSTNSYNTAHSKRDSQRMNENGKENREESRSNVHQSSVNSFYMNGAKKVQLHNLSEPESLKTSDDAKDFATPTTSSDEPDMNVNFELINANIGLRKPPLTVSSMNSCGGSISLPVNVKDTDVSYNVFRYIYRNNLPGFQKMPILSYLPVSLVSAWIDENSKRIEKKEEVFVNCKRQVWASIYGDNSPNGTQEDISFDRALKLACHPSFSSPSSLTTNIVKYLGKGTLTGETNESLSKTGKESKEIDSNDLDKSHRKCSTSNIRGICNVNLLEENRSSSYLSHLNISRKLYFNYHHNEIGKLNVKRYIDAVERWIMSYSYNPSSTSSCFFTADDEFLWRRLMRETQYRYYYDLIHQYKSSSSSEFKEKVTSSKIETKYTTKNEEISFSSSTSSSFTNKFTSFVSEQDQSLVEPTPLSPLMHDAYLAFLNEFYEILRHPWQMLLREIELVHTIRDLNESE